MRLGIDIFKHITDLAGVENLHLLIKSLAEENKQSYSYKEFDSEWGVATHIQAYIIERSVMFHWFSYLDKETNLCGLLCYDGELKEFRVCTEPKYVDITALSANVFALRMWDSWDICERGRLICEDVAGYEPVEIGDSMFLLLNSRKDKRMCIWFHEDSLYNHVVVSSVAIFQHLVQTRIITKAIAGELNFLPVSFVFGAIDYMTKWLFTSGRFEVFSDLSNKE